VGVGGGTREEPGTLTQGGALFSLVPLVWESNPKLQVGWCKNQPPARGGRVVCKKKIPKSPRTSRKTGQATGAPGRPWRGADRCTALRWRGPTASGPTPGPHADAMCARSSSCPPSSMHTRAAAESATGRKASARKGRGRVPAGVGVGPATPAA
jgi:hypothetical protein